MVQLAYILAASHSGSTLLAMLLGAHPDVVTVGELKLSPASLGDVATYRCSCGALIRSCPFWRQVAEGMARRGLAFDVADAGTDYRVAGGGYVRRLLQPLHRGPLMERVRDAALWLSPTWRHRLPQIQRENAALAEAACQIAGARVIVDSSKLALRLKYLLRNDRLDVKVIRLIRDGRGAALAYMAPPRFADARLPYLRGGGSGGEGPEPPLSMAQAARQWRRSNEEAEYLLARLDRSRWVEVRYEQLCAEPDTTLARLCEFLGVDSGQAVRDFRAVPQHVIGNGMRLDATSEIRLDERWKTILAAEHLRVFNAVAGDLNRLYGYA